ncbi:MAG: tetratricopeptide repeat protein [Streptosporangiaceae bacterium]|nr:tetratricopeptide repeat protein [Streptosporangiaceae bacterium]
MALNGLGEAVQAMGQSAEAMTHHSTALSLALDTDDREQQARAHAGLGRAFGALAQPRRAREHLQQAVALYADLGYPEAEQIRAELAGHKHPS